MSAARKPLPPPPGGDDLQAALQRRLRRDDEDSPPSGDASGATRTTDESGSTRRTRAKSATPLMDRRSWYMPKDSADALAAALQDLYWSTHRPKHEVLAALIETALAHRDEVQARLSQ
jgi:hypothetical protein